MILSTLSSEIIPDLDLYKNTRKEYKIDFQVISLMEKHSDVPICPSQMTSMIEMLRKEDQVGIFVVKFYSCVVLG